MTFHACILRRQGLAGALYPMVAFAGVECRNEWEITFEEIHRNGRTLNKLDLSAAEWQDRSIYHPV